MLYISLLSRQLGFTLTYTGSKLERTEHGLEKEIRRESCAPPRKNTITRLRNDGELILHSKDVLMLIVVLNLVDCCLVLGELILDIHYITEHPKKYLHGKRILVQTIAGLTVAVRDHEHIRLKMLYKEEKMISAQLERLEETKN
ncbi:uncharacterized protein LOC127850267 isoform X3 [Dreissena polymorpha]|uniref:uncharacterized protein LOC127850267 isoform X3 n=1 Tax=Dreissena polymorpha TaxID=45954 RepID=UPI00226512CF|nr:uncharacterized protein LOC127850267 isoform X3 [Dreissena polymorpha]